MLQPTEVRPFLSHRDGFVRDLALSYLASAHDLGQATQDDLWATIDRYGEAPAQPKAERRTFARCLPQFPATERSIERLLRGLAIEPDDEVKRHLLRAAAELPAEALDRLLGDARIASGITAAEAGALREALDLAGKGPDELWDALDEQASRLQRDPRIRPIGGFPMQASPLFQRAERIVCALARHAAAATERGLSALREPRDPDRVWDEALAVRIFTRVRLPGPERRLLDIVDEGGPDLTRVYVADALVRLGTREVVAALVDRFGDRPRRLADVAVDILHGIKRPEAEAVLLRSFEDVDEASFRVQVALRLCQMGTSSSAALEAMEPMVRVRTDDEELLELRDWLSALKLMLGLTSPDAQDSKLKVFLDDERPAPEGWTPARWPEEVIALLQFGEVEAMSLDHDLGDVARTGYDVLRWLESAVIVDGLEPPARITIHSANAGARRRMELAIASIRRHARGAVGAAK
jgi:hypothetical protein